MSVANGMLVSSGEKDTYRILEKYSGFLKVFTKVRFFDVIDWDSPSIKEKEHPYLEKTHFDFLVCEPDEPYKPLFAVEFDGIGINYEKIDPYRQLKKDTKSHICQAEGFPLIWLDFEDVESIDGETLLDFLLKNYIGRRFVDDLKAKREAPMDDAFAIVFEPTLNLLNELGGKIVKANIKNMNFSAGTWIVTGEVEYKTNDGLKHIERTVKFSTNNFPNEFSGFLLLFADDLAHYQCLYAIRKLIKQDEKRTFRF